MKVFVSFLGLSVLHQAAILMETLTVFGAVNIWNENIDSILTVIG